MPLERKLQKIYNCIEPNIAKKVESVIKDFEYQQLKSKVIRKIRSDIADAMGGFLTRKILPPIEIMTTGHNLIERIASDELAEDEIKGLLFVRFMDSIYFDKVYGEYVTNNQKVFNRRRREAYYG